MDEWPFSDPPNVAVFTVQAVFAGTTIRLVRHDVDEDECECWQFLTGEPISMSDAMLVGLNTIVKVDPTVRDLADLPVGWQAERESIGDPWTRKPFSN